MALTLGEMMRRAGLTAEAVAEMHGDVSAEDVRELERFQVDDIRRALDLVGELAKQLGD